MDLAKDIPVWNPNQQEWGKIIRSDEEMYPWLSTSQITMLKDDITASWLTWVEATNMSNEIFQDVTRINTYNEKMEWRNMTMNNLISESSKTERDDVTKANDQLFGNMTSIADWLREKEFNEWKSWDFATDSQIIERYSQELDEEWQEALRLALNWEWIEQQFWESIAPVTELQEAQELEQEEQAIEEDTSTINPFVAVAKWIFRTGESIVEWAQQTTEAILNLSDKAALWMANLVRPLIWKDKLTTEEAIAAVPWAEKWLTSEISSDLLSLGEGTVSNVFNAIAPYTMITMNAANETKPWSWILEKMGEWITVWWEYINKAPVLQDFKESLPEDEQTRFDSMVWWMATFLLTKWARKKTYEWVKNTIKTIWEGNIIKLFKDVRANPSKFRQSIKDFKNRNIKSKIAELEAIGEVKWTYLFQKGLKPEALKQITKSKNYTEIKTKAQKLVTDRANKLDKILEPVKDNPVNTVTLNKPLHQLLKEIKSSWAPKSEISIIENMIKEQSTFYRGKKPTTWFAQGNKKYWHKKLSEYYKKQSNKEWVTEAETMRAQGYKAKIKWLQNAVEESVKWTPQEGLVRKLNAEQGWWLEILEKLWDTSKWWILNQLAKWKTAPWFIRKWASKTPWIWRYLYKDMVKTLNKLETEVPGITKQIETIRGKTEALKAKISD